MINAETYPLSTDREPHKDRRMAILKVHPEVRDLIGRNPWSALIICGLVATQLFLAILLARSPWWIILLIAYSVGAILSHGLYVMIHEGAHQLIFASRPLNSGAAMVANLPSLLPMSASFRNYHLQHHAFQGSYELDADIASEWEARFVGHSSFRKALWLVLFPVFQVVRTFRLTRIPVFDSSVVVNIAVQLTFDGLVFSLLGGKAFAYLLVSMLASVGFHPLGARWIQKHYVTHGRQETYSYYGLGNTVAFNVGYHNEHHDFPSVPWNRLPEVRAIAGTWYEGLVSYTSWTRLLLKFVFDRSLSLRSRIVRSEIEAAVAKQAAFASGRDEAAKLTAS
jgi:sphingolipid delta-4 desaturase